MFQLLNDHRNMYVKADTKLTIMFCTTFILDVNIVKI